MSDESCRPTTVGGSFMYYLLWMIDHKEPQWRIDGAAKSLLGKIILSLPVDKNSNVLAKIHTEFDY